MKTLFQLILIAFLGCLVSCTTSTGEAPASGDSSSAPVKGQSAVKDDLSQKNILQIAAGSPDHTTLAAACVAAGLEDVLVNAGPLTVFAPTNDAFDALPAGTVENLLKDENIPTLARIIKYHAAPGSYQVGMLKDGQRLFMASGHYIEVSVEGDNVSLGGAKILGTVAASNGIVHVVDKVLLPPD